MVASIHHQHKIKTTQTKAPASSFSTTSIRPSLLPEDLEVQRHSTTEAKASDAAADGEDIETARIEKDLVELPRGRQSASDAVAATRSVQVRRQCGRRVFRALKLFVQLDGLITIFGTGRNVEVSVKTFCSPVVIKTGKEDGQYRTQTHVHLKVSANMQTQN